MRPLGRQHGLGVGTSPHPAGMQSMGGGDGWRGRWRNSSVYFCTPPSCLDRVQAPLAPCLPALPLGARFVRRRLPSDRLAKTIPTVPPGARPLAVSTSSFECISISTGFGQCRTSTPPRLRRHSPRHGSLPCSRLLAPASSNPPVPQFRGGMTPWEYDAEDLTRNDAEDFGEVMRRIPRPMGQQPTAHAVATNRNVLSHPVGRVATRHAHSQTDPPGSFSSRHSHGHHDTALRSECAPG